MSLGGTSARVTDLFHPGEVLSETYEIRGKIGEGGMGQVYDAYDLRIGRHVAIKAACPGSAVPVSREARALGALHQHPGMVAVHALGVHAGVEYAVMDRILGATLEQHLERHRSVGSSLPIDEIVAILRGAADGLAVVHRAGMAHRDVKPANLILAPGNRVVLTDFGIFQPESELTESAIVCGTPRYMAPEAITGSIEPGELFLVDVYALGIVAYEMLTGSVPFDHEAAGKLLWMHVSEPVPDVSRRRPDTPPRLAALVRDMMAKDPQARPLGMDPVVWQLGLVSGERSGPLARAVLPCR